MRRILQYMIRKFGTFFLLVLVIGVVASTPAVASAQTLSASREAQIETLLREVARLQVLLVELQQRQTTTVPTTVYKSRFFDVSFEAVYHVGKEGLVRIDRTAPVRQSDEQLYNLLVAVVGKQQLGRYVDDFRVFHDSDGEAGAFVESKAKSDYWIFGVNRDGWRQTDRQARASFIDLFLHEYAHLVLLENDEFTEGFAERFWTDDDQEHAEAVKNERRRFRLLETYYEDNEDRFVSDYATLSVDEDIAETFVRFVIRVKPSGSSVVDQKIRYFYESPELVTERARLRQNLSALGVRLK